MKFGTIDFVLKRCEDHLNATATQGTEIESYFVQYLLVRICAEYEMRITTLFHRRCSRTRDAELRSFAQKTAAYVCKYFSISDIGKILERFGDAYKKQFNIQVMGDSAHVAWDNIYTNRQAVAHKVAPQMSFGDLKLDYQSSLRVLDALVLALQLRPREIHDLA